MKSRAPFFPDLSRREKVYEHLDDPHSDPFKIEASFRQFSRINFWLSGVMPALKKNFLKESRRRPGTTLTFLDVGAGSGDIVTRLMGFARERHIRVRFTCLDLDPRAIRILKSRFAKHKSVVRIIHTDLQKFLKKRAPGFDFIFANHVLHHFGDAEIPNILKTLSRRTKLRLFLNDIHRSLFSYWGFGLFAAVFLRGSFHFHDGLASVRRGFRREELLAWITKAGIRSSTKIWTPALGRMGLVFSPPRPG
ncbi:MAG: methyltransferase domain-containing protein [Spirochaetia bacterium]|nr:methyltransferase domain-containing protein [Spirochaetia bacterium]